MSEVSNTDLIKEVKAKVTPKALGINSVRLREAANGGVVIEVWDPEAAEKADVLARRISEITGNRARVTRPTWMGEFRLRKPRSHHFRRGY